MYTMITCVNDKYGVKDFAFLSETLTEDDIDDIADFIKQTIAESDGSTNFKGNFK